MNDQIIELINERDFLAICVFVMAIEIFFLYINKFVVSGYSLLG